MTSAKAGRPATVVHLLATLDPGGVERSVLELIRHLDPARFRSEVWFLTGRGSLEATFRRAGATTRRVPLLTPCDLSVVPRLTFALRRAGAAILHTHHPGSTAFGRLAAPRSGLRAVVTTEHSVTHWSKPGAFVNRLVRATAGTADQVVSVSKAVEYLSQGAGAAIPGRSRIIPDGVTLSRPAADAAGRKSESRKSFGLHENAPIIGSIGRLAPHKGFANLIEMIPLVLSERADAMFALAGAGPLRSSLESLARKLGVADRLIFTGAVLDPYAFLPALDVMVVPSLTEGGGLAVLEAMAHGVPVVGTQVGGLPDILETGEGGLLVSPNAPREMAAVVLYLLNSALYSASVGGAGRDRIASGGPGSAVFMAGAHTELYDELLTRL